MFQEYVVGTVLMLLAVPVLAAPEAVEIGASNVEQLPGGREADGIIGDFVLRNERIEAVISGNQPGRKANMTVFWAGPTPGCLYDLCPRGSHNDQLTYFGPGRQVGALSSVRILKTGEDGEAIVRAELTEAGGDGLGKTHDYMLRDGWDYLLVVSTYHNATPRPRTIRVSGEWKGLVHEASVGQDAGGGTGATSAGEGTGGTLTGGTLDVGSTSVGECQDPADRIGYAFAPVRLPDAEPRTPATEGRRYESLQPKTTLGNAEIPPGKSLRFASAIAVGSGSADAFGIIEKLRGEPTRHVSGRVHDKSGQPARTARLSFEWKNKSLVSFIAADGTFDFLCPAAITQVTFKDIGRPDQTIKWARDLSPDVAVPNASGVQASVNDERGGPLPCKVQFIGVEGTPTPDLGPIIRAHGCDNQYQSESGHFTQPLPPGHYHVVITRGIEYDHAERDVEVSAGTIVPIEATLHRVVDTTGWISADFHNHSTPSGDNYCGTDDRVINLAAEHIEFAPTTEHNRIYDWQPHIDRLGLHAFVATVQGIELTGGGPHLNSFPLKPVPYRQDNGAPQWDPDPRISAMLLRRHPGELASRWVQLNHPNIARYFNDANADGKPDGGFKHLESFIDAMESYNDSILSGEPKVTYHYQGKTFKRESQPFAWLQLLNAGIRIWMVAVSDAHQVTQGGVGGWRMYVRSGQDEPAKVDYQEIIANAKAGHSFISTGPFLEVRLADGHGPGDTIVTKDPVRLHVRVQCNTWTDIDRVAVLVNGRLDPKLDFRRAERPEMFRKGVVRFEEDLTVNLTRDAHLIVVAIGEGTTLEKGYGRSWQRELHPVAYHNPIYVDVDGNGFQANGDTLGHPYLGLQQQEE